VTTIRRRIAATVAVLCILLALHVVSVAAAGQPTPPDVPVASPTCPSPDGSGGSGIIGALEHVPILGAGVALADNVGTMAATVMSWIRDPGQMIHDVVGWFTWHLIGWNPDAPDCYEPTSGYGFWRSVVLGDVRLSASGVYHDAYNSMAIGGTLLVLFAGMMRALRMAGDRQADWRMQLTDVVPRTLLGIGAVQLGFSALDLVLPLFSGAGAEIFKTLAGLAGKPIDGSDPLALVLFSSLVHAPGLGLVALLLIPVLLVLLVRVLFLLLGRFLIISFGIAFAPLVIAAAVFDHRTRLVQWYIGTMGGAAITPVVSGAMLGMTVGLSLRFAQGDQSFSSLAYGPLVGIIVEVGGLWLTRKAIRALIFSAEGGHGSVLGVLRNALEMLVVLPMIASAIAGPAAVAAVVPGRAGRVLASLGSYGLAKGGLVGAVQSSAIAGEPSAVYAQKSASAFEMFATSQQGSELVTQATEGLVPSGTATEARWAYVARSEGMAQAMDALRASVFASHTRTGSATAAPQDAAAFLRAADRLRGDRRTTSPPDGETE
jgi:uncharacterized membrane protein YvlD (DUF360 family)